MTFIWREAETTFCSCEEDKPEIHLFDVHRSHRGSCHERCEGQICGDSKSVFVALNKDYPIVGKDCEEIIMLTSNPPIGDTVVLENELKVNIVCLVSKIWSSLLNFIKRSIVGTKVYQFAKLLF